MEHNINLYDYLLPDELIAQSPLDKRDSSRLMTLDKRTGAVCHRNFSDIAEMLRPNDCLVLNNTRVIKARLLGERTDTGGTIELLLLNPITDTKWEALAKPGKRALPQRSFTFRDGLTATIESVLDNGNRVVQFSCDGDFNEWLDANGIIPLPPYITQSLSDSERYQTVYAQHKGSVAAPTAGLHFTSELLKSIRDKGVSVAELTLHVGVGTFRPVKESDITRHEMHSEAYSITPAAWETIAETKRRGGRIIAVGTTSVRTLESIAATGNLSGGTNIFIYPPYDFKIVDALVTNFHLPKSTLLMLISALAGRENVLSAYAQAVENRYRFFSFGDAMFIH